MRIFVAEYAVANNDVRFIEQGMLMLNTLVASFSRSRHTVYYPTAGARLSCGHALPSTSFFKSLAFSKNCDAGMVIAPDELLKEATEILEENTCNLGSPPDAVHICADKLACTQVLQQHDLPVPRTVVNCMTQGDWVVKPRFGCGSERINKVNVTSTQKIPNDTVATEYIKGEHISVSLVASNSSILPLTINRQIIHHNRGSITYHGNQTPFEVENREEVIGIASKAVKILGCRGYAGVDIINSNQPCIVDVNPRATTSIVSVSQILTGEIAELILQAKNDILPSKIDTLGSAEMILSE
ncbi:MAG: ATP-grasp domain-containing protein [Methanosarcinales archaeon]|uniref:ATP-grasp domain-containing protein n=1 Tax=Candidatus Ethanoperedens thermophilum TaxID=2766897 RepID=A0A848DA15_9EURY|nr:ATP-grasp domain-containing protein [Candidatus Ethanoperedens thermophilum]